MPKTIKLTEKEWDNFIYLVQTRVAKAYICMRFGITTGEYKKLVRQLNGGKRVSSKQP